MSLYDTDFYAWTQDQVAALRRVEDARINLPGVDLAHVIEEIGDMGHEVLGKIEGLVTQIIAHLFKLRHSDFTGPRNHWIQEITAWRQAVVRRSKRSPSALHRLDLNELAADALRRLRKDEAHRSWAKALPTTCPFSLEQVLDEDFVPGADEDGPDCGNVQ